MSEDIINKTEYIIIFISEFARRYGLTNVAAYRYLARYKAIDFLDTHYEIAHTQGFNTMVEDIATYCRRFGGAII